MIMMGIAIGVFMLPVLYDVMRVKKMESSTEYKDGYIDGYEEYWNGNATKYKMMITFIRNCESPSPERNYACGYANGYENAREAKQTDIKRATCKSERYLIRESMRED